MKIIIEQNDASMTVTYDDEHVHDYHLPYVLDEHRVQQMFADWISANFFKFFKPEGAGGLQYERDLETLLDDRDMTLQFDKGDYVFKDQNGAVVASSAYLTDAIEKAFTRITP